MTSDGRRLLRMSPPDQRRARLQRSAVFWMLHEAGVSFAAIGAAVGLTGDRVSIVVRLYENELERKLRAGPGRDEPWARRLRAAGAIP